MQARTLRFSALAATLRTVMAFSTGLLNVRSSLPRHVDVIVVGCGAAGLGACKTLLDAGKRVLLLEAADRIGGRILSQGALEIGAQWMHGIEGHPLYEYACQHGLMDAVKKNDEGEYDYPSLERLTFTARREGGQEEDKGLLAEVGRVFEEIEEQCAELGDSAEERTSLEFFERRFRAWVENKGREEERRRIFRHFLNRQACIDGGDLGEQSPAQFSNYRDLEGPLLVRVPGGYSRILHHIAERLPEGTRRTNSPVEVVHWGPTAGVTVKGGQVVEANHVVITASLGVLKSGGIRFDPPLPAEKQAAISRMGMGMVEKVFFEFSEEQWLLLEEMGFSHMNILLPQSPHTESWIGRTTGFFRAPETRYAYTWVTGEVACAQVASSSPEQLIADLQGWLSRFYPECSVSSLKALSVIKSDWACNDLTKGSYSFLASGSAPQDIATLAQPLGANDQVLFAGEATHPQHFGTVHGAFASGVREAERVLCGGPCTATGPGIG